VHVHRHDVGAIAAAVFCTVNDAVTFPLREVLGVALRPLTLNVVYESPKPIG